MSSKFFDTSNLRGDLYGGLTAGVVALPLALAFGAASGAGPIAGVYGAIIVGFFAALFGGTGSQITGPTGPMVVVFAGVLPRSTATHHSSLRPLFWPVLYKSCLAYSGLVNTSGWCPTPLYLDS